MTEEDFIVIPYDRIGNQCDSLSGEEEDGGDGRAVTNGDIGYDDEGKDHGRSEDGNIGSENEDVEDGEFDDEDGEGDVSYTASEMEHFMAPFMAYRNEVRADTDVNRNCGRSGAESSSNIRQNSSVNDGIEKGWDDLNNADDDRDGLEDRNGNRSTDTGGEERIVKLSPSLEKLFQELMHRNVYSARPGR